jgi:hypothetical protein
MKFRRLFRFRLRTLLVLVALLSVWLTWHVRATRSQKEAAQAIQEYGGWIRYDFQFPKGIYAHQDFASKAKSRVPEWLLAQLGHDFFHNVVQVNLNYSNDSGKRQENDNPSDEALQHLVKLPHLRALLLSDSQATDSSMQYLAALKKLEYLYMWDVAEVSDEGVSHLRSLRRLKYIHLSTSQITDESLRVFGELHELEGLSLQFNRFSDEGLSHLLQLQKLTSLAVCGLSERPNKITDAGLRMLLSLPQLKSLMVQNTKVTEPGLINFREKLPQCQITE